MRDFAANPLRVAMIGMIPENFHPYSWSAIINGYDPEQMAQCPARVIPEYLNRQPPGSVGIPFAKVTCIWTDNPTDAPKIAAAALIPAILRRPEDAIGQVDAVIISTDDGDDHVRRAEPFVGAGVPVFVDKPLATNVQDLGHFVAWRQAGKIVMSSSGLRYSPEVAALRGRSWRWLTGVTCKTWERYGIHVLEPIATVVGRGFERVRATQRAGNFHAEIEHRTGTVISLTAIAEGYGSAFVLHGYEDHGHSVVEMRDTYRAFRAQLLGFLTAVAGLGPEPVAFAETVELMATVIAARESADSGGRAVEVKSVLQRLPA